MKKQLMIALLSIAPALGVVAQDKLYKDEFRGCNLNCVKACS